MDVAGGACEVDSDERALEFFGSSLLCLRLRLVAGCGDVVLVVVVRKSVTILCVRLLGPVVGTLVASGGGLLHGGLSIVGKGLSVGGTGTCGGGGFSGEYEQELVPAGVPVHWCCGKHAGHNHIGHLSQVCRKPGLRPHLLHWAPLFLCATLPLASWW